MHTLQPKHIKLKQEEVNNLAEKYVISISQLPKIKSTDPCLPEGCIRGDVIKIERENDDKKIFYYRVVI
jgi:DNA-directed RNA polymerase subunit H (RpoH/RPB5)